jgi:hypothetical protein
VGGGRDAPKITGDKAYQKRALEVTLSRPARRNLFPGHSPLGATDQLGHYRLRLQPSRLSKAAGTVYKLFYLAVTF